MNTAMGTLLVTLGYNHRLSSTRVFPAVKLAPKDAMAPCSKLLSRVQSRVDSNSSSNFLPLIRHNPFSRHRARLGYGRRAPKICCDDGSQVVFKVGRTMLKRNFVAVVRAAETVVDSPDVSPLTLKAQSDDYFLTDSRPVILFDGVCNMCNGGVNFMLDNDAEGKIRFAALQSAAGRSLLDRSGRAPDDISSIVLVDKDRAYVKSEAILRISQYLRFPFPAAAFLRFIVPMFLRDALYDIVAGNRYSVLGTTTQCRFSDSRFGERFIE